MAACNDCFVDSEGVLSEEIAVLESIYITEFTVERDVEGEPTCASILLHPATGMDESKKYVCMTLCFRFPPEYPDKPPEITVRNPRGLGDEELQSLIEDMKKLAEHRRGASMLFELIEMAKDCLTQGNIPHCECAICLENFHEGDNFIKTACYHYFHRHCLARYAKAFVAKQEREAEDAAPAHLTSAVQEKSLDCPMCRLPLSMDMSAFLEEWIPADDTFDFVPTSEIRQQQEEMEALFRQQKARGGIIDLDEERNKFLVDEKTVVYLERPVKESQSLLQDGPDSGHRSSKQPHRGQRMDRAGRDRRSHNGRGGQHKLQKHSDHGALRDRGSRGGRGCHIDDRDNPGNENARLAEAAVGQKIRRPALQSHSNQAGRDSTRVECNGISPSKSDSPSGRPAFERGNRRGNSRDDPEKSHERPDTGRSDKIDSDTGVGPSGESRVADASVDNRADEREGCKDNDRVKRVGMHGSDEVNTGKGNSNTYQRKLTTYVSNDSRREGMRDRRDRGTGARCEDREGVKRVGHNQEDRDDGRRVGHNQEDRDDGRRVVHNQDNRDNARRVVHNQDDRDDGRRVGHNQEDRDDARRVVHNQEDRDVFRRVGHNQDDRDDARRVGINQDDRDGARRVVHNQDNRDNARRVVHNQEDRDVFRRVGHNQDNRDNARRVVHNQEDRDDGRRVGHNQDDRDGARRVVDNQDDRDDVRRVGHNQDDRDDARTRRVVHNQDNRDNARRVVHNQEDRDVFRRVGHNQDDRDDARRVGINQEDRDDVRRVGHNQDDRDDARRVGINQEDRDDVRRVGHNQDDRDDARTRRVVHSQEDRDDARIFLHNQKDRESARRVRHNQEDGDSARRVDHKHRNPGSHTQKMDHPGEAETSRLETLLGKDKHIGSTGSINGNAEGKDGKTNNESCVRSSSDRSDLSENTAEAAQENSKDQRKDVIKRPRDFKESSQRNSANPQNYRNNGQRRPYMSKNNRDSQRQSDGRQSEVKILASDRQSPYLPRYDNDSQRNHDNHQSESGFLALDRQGSYIPRYNEDGQRDHDDHQSEGKFLASDRQGSYIPRYNKDGQRDHDNHQSEDDRAVSARHGSYIPRHGKDRHRVNDKHQKSDDRPVSERQGSHALRFDRGNYRGNDRQQNGGNTFMPDKGGSNVPSQPHAENGSANHNKQHIVTTEDPGCERTKDGGQLSVAHKNQPVSDSVGRHTGERQSDLDEDREHRLANDRRYSDHRRGVRGQREGRRSSAKDSLDPKPERDARSKRDRDWRREPPAAQQLQGTASKDGEIKVKRAPPGFHVSGPPPGFVPAGSYSRSDSRIESNPPPSVNSF